MRILGIIIEKIGLALLIIYQITYLAQGTPDDFPRYFIWVIAGIVLFGALIQFIDYITKKVKNK
ncbi:hypothetical protein [Salibacterium halotolerans]|uniref:Uncharacterized protein n=1 Tax=Salibacterium halotolerans TaxID=1884432 RepID=A0A1I5PQA6_9BACI|nr:hypothetical protein [Salibacterium halotolerans]SFP36189.1 hypothetical protein SAMN05518683_104193 [Salibacterium halotolerans]